MPYGDPDPADPQVLVGVGFPGDPGAMREMAHAFVEEFAAIGHGERRILELFQSPFYAGPYAAGRALGHDEIRRIVADHFRFRDEIRTGVKRSRALDSDPVQSAEDGGENHD